MQGRKDALGIPADCEDTPRGVDNCRYAAWPVDLGDRDPLRHRDADRRRPVPPDRNPVDPREGKYPSSDLIRIQLDHGPRPPQPRGRDHGIATGMANSANHDVARREKWGTGRDPSADQHRHRRKDDHRDLPPPMISLVADRHPTSRDSGIDRKLGRRSADGRHWSVPDLNAGHRPSNPATPLLTPAPNPLIGPNR
jgi:hypothetical protein